MDITLLPEEIFFCIAKYLSADDLLSCSLVNFSWRNAINHNEIWQQVCKSLIHSITGEELNHMKSLVTNYSEHEPYSALDFEPLCKWRKTFMRWKTLKNNWKQGKYKRFVIENTFSSLLSSEYYNNFLLLIFDDIREISVWDIKNIPSQKERIQFCLAHVRSEFVKLCNNYLVIVQCNLLQVYYYSEDRFQLWYRCLFDQHDSESQKLPDYYDITHWYCLNVGLYPCDLTLRCEQNGDKFIGAILDNDYSNTVLHVWDISKKIKQVQVTIPQISDVVTDINFSVADESLYIMMHCISGTSKSYDSVLVYDLKCCQFLEFKLNFTYRVPAFIFFKQFIFAVDKIWNSVDVWKLNSNFNEKIKCGFLIEPKCFNVEGSHLLIGGKYKSQYSSTTVNVYNLSNLNCSFTISVSYTVDFITLIQSTFLILGAFSCRRFISVLDITRHICLYTIENDDCIFLNSTHSKLVTRMDNELSVISFW